MVAVVSFPETLWQGVQNSVGMVCAWGFLGMLGLSLMQLGRDLIQRSRRMHAIPCSRCQFFTRDYRLKCPVHPLTANTETAIDCRDYLAQETERL
jgi:hypothetical protein